MLLAGVEGGHDDALVRAHPSYSGFSTCVMSWYNTNDDDDDDDGFGRQVVGRGGG